MARKIIVVGCEGQDGRLLSQAVQTCGDTLLGIGKKKVVSNDSGCPFELVDINDINQVFTVVQYFEPDEVYFLPGVHHSSDQTLPDDLELFQKSYEVHVRALQYFLEAIRKTGNQTRLFYAASSHIFGDQQLVNESSPMNPVNIYGITKLMGLQTCRYFRQMHGVFASTGILFNHESKLRAPQFLSKRIINGALAIQRGEATELRLGNLSAKTDWGYAPDYVEAMQKTLSISTAEEFIIATGKSHSVLDFVKAVFGQLGLDWEKYVHEDPSLIRKANFGLTGDSTKLRKLTGWEPSVDFEGMIPRLLDREGRLSHV